MNIINYTFFSFFNYYFSDVVTHLALMVRSALVQVVRRNAVKFHKAVCYFVALSHFSINLRAGPFSLYCSNPCDPFNSTFCGGTGAVSIYSAFSGIF